MPVSRKQLKHLRSIASLGGATITEARGEASRANGAKGGRPSATLPMQARIFAEHVAKGTAPQIGPRLHAYILEHSKDAKVRKAATAALSDRTLWTLTEEARKRSK